MKNILILLFLSISFAIEAQEISLRAGNTIEKNYYTEIPFEYINGKIIILVTINDDKYRFLLDTGAPNLITDRLRNQLNLKSLKEKNVSDASNIKSTMHIVALPNLKIGTVTFENSVALSSNIENNLVFDCFKIDGFIGSNLFTNSIIQIDIKKKIIILTDNQNRLDLGKKNRIKLALFGEQSMPFIWLKLHGTKNGKEQVLLDTGMKGFYDISLNNYKKFKDKKVYFNEIGQGIGSESIGLSGNSTINNHFRLKLDSISIINSSFKNIYTTTTNDDNSRLGSEFFENGISTFDFLNKNFYYQAYIKTIDLTETIKPFSTTIINDKLSIGIVWSEKLKNEIQAGNEIIEINGKNYEQYKICDFINTSVFKNLLITQVKVRLKDGNTKILTL